MDQFTYTKPYGWQPDMARQMATIASYANGSGYVPVPFEPTGTPYAGGRQLAKPLGHPTFVTMTYAPVAASITMVAMTLLTHADLRRLANADTIIEDVESYLFSKPGDLDKYISNALVQCVVSTPAPHQQRRRLCRSPILQRCSELRL